MSTIINIRGTNGSGKTTLVREFLGEKELPVDLLWYDSPTKKDPKRKKAVEGEGSDCGKYVAVGSYKQGCGGMDTINSFTLQHQGVEKAIEKFPQCTVLCEGVLASTVAGSWLKFLKEQQNKGHKVLVAYLDTPIDLCLERIKERQRVKGKVRPINVELVKDKIKSVAATKSKFEFAGIKTVKLRHDQAKQDLLTAVGNL